MRQGFPLGTLLFNIYINDLLYQLDDQNPEISKSVMMSCLAYADDILIISKTDTVLQRTLHALETFCKTWQKNKANKNEIFHFNEKMLSNATEFVYLGLKIDAKGSLQNSLKFLSEKAMRAGFALNKKMKIKMIPVNVALRLFDACILPTLTYGAKIWAAFERFDFDTWEKCPIKQVHLRYCKHLLGVNKSTINLLCRAELGRRPIKLITDLKVINFYNTETLCQLMICPTLR